MATGRPEEIADLCQRVFSDAGLADRLSAGAAEFARRSFDLATNSKVLARFYQGSCLLWRQRRRPTFRHTPAVR